MAASRTVQGEGNQQAAAMQTATTASIPRKKGEADAVGEAEGLHLFARD